jgi:large subunit ribosomal protein L29
MKAEKIRELDTAELRNRSTETQEQMFRLRFQMSMGQTDQVKKFRELKKDRARMLGILRERELDPSKAQAVEAAPEAKPRAAKPAAAKKVKAAPAASAPKPKKTVARPAAAKPAKKAARPAGAAIKAIGKKKEK